MDTSRIDAEIVLQHVFVRALPLDASGKLDYEEFRARQRPAVLSLP